MENQPATISDDKNGTRITIAETDLDFDNAQRIKEFIQHSALESKKSIIIDMARVTFIDSAGIAMLVQLVQKYSNSARRVEFAGITPEVRKTLKLVNLERFFKTT